MKNIVIFVEGETEEELYNAFILKDIKSKLSNNKYTCNFSVHNVRGFGGFKNDAIRKYKNDILKKYPNDDFFVFLCYDTDVFEIASKPKIDWKLIDKSLKDAGVKRVIHIKAKTCIEDWLLADLKNICKYLRISQNVTVKGKNGFEKMKTLFKKANKIYVKGKKVEGLLSKLDINIIIEKYLDELKSLYKEFGVII